ncbi:apolipoprotein D-like [Leptidea sinapis]|uniref:apolipoprotein D-like n=1 Tax=Leptidea sinapis TaxID=189913 RepID=UPI00212A572D|nr:apolipoprotein D-like [Leptidea sinapis]
MWRLSVLVLLATASAQIPSLGWCPDYQPMANFNMNRFLGNWYEAERYFTVSELATRCVNTKYEATPEGRIIVSNEITNSLTGLKRVMDGTLENIGREGEGRLVVKYSSLPVPYDSEFSVLGTDYDNYAVMWSCSGIGPVHIQNAWLLTRERLAPPAVLQSAYAVLDKYKLSRTFFVKTNQGDCNILPEPAAEPMIKSEEVDAKNAPIVPEADVEVEPSVVKKSDPETVPEKIEQPVVPEMPAETKPVDIPEVKAPEEMKPEKFEKPEEMMEKKEDMPMKTEQMEMKPEQKEKMPEKTEKKPEKTEKKPEKTEKKPEKMEKKPEKLEKPLQ